MKLFPRFQASLIAGLPTCPMPWPVTPENWGRVENPVLVTVKRPETMPISILHVL